MGRQGIRAAAAGALVAAGVGALVGALAVRGQAGPSTQGIEQAAAAAATVPASASAPTTALAAAADLQPAPPAPSPPPPAIGAPAGSRCGGVCGTSSTTAPQS